MKKILLGLICGVMLLSANQLGAESRIDELKSEIEKRNQEIAKLELEIKSYQEDLTTTEEQANSLQQEVGRLNLTIKKLTTDIKVTETKIANTESNIEKLNLEIDKSGQKIGSNKESIRETLRLLQTANQDSLMEVFLKQNRLADFWEEEEQLTKLQAEVFEGTKVLQQTKQTLEDDKQEAETERQKLVSLTEQLADQQEIVAGNRKTKSELLTQTKNEEANYRRLLSERQAKRDAFARELFEFESQLRLEIDPSSIPPAGKGILRWPLDAVHITQYFGRTVDAARLYTSGTHNGVDFRASPGTVVRAAADGLVKGTGNTDNSRGCYSYGKWVLIEHNNGLSTLYAHLSLIKVNPGQRILRGEVLGYSGATGYATGPHLHFTVYASAGVQIRKYDRSINCKSAEIPIADIKAYLDPLIYL